MSGDIKGLDFRARLLRVEGQGLAKSVETEKEIEVIPDLVVEQGCPLTEKGKESLKEFSSNKELKARFEFLGNNWDCLLDSIKASSGFSMLPIPEARHYHLLKPRDEKYLELAQSTVTSEESLKQTEAAIAEPIVNKTVLVKEEDGSDSSAAQIITPDNSSAPSAPDGSDSSAAQNITPDNSFAVSEADGSEIEKSKGHLVSDLSDKIFHGDLKADSNSNVVPTAKRVEVVASKVIKHVVAFSEAYGGLAQDATIASLRLANINFHIDTIANAIMPPPLLTGGISMPDIGVFDLPGTGYACIGEAFIGVVGTIALVSGSVKLEKLRSAINGLKRQQNVLKNKPRKDVVAGDDIKVAKLGKEISILQSVYRNGVLGASMGGVALGATVAHVGIQIGLPITSKVSIVASNALLGACAVVGTVITAHEIYQDYKAGKAISKEMATLHNLDNAIEKQVDPEVRSVIKGIRSFRNRRLLNQKEGIRVSNIRNGMTIAGSAAMAVSTSLSIAAVGATGGIAVAAAAMGIGAIVVGSLALAIGIGFLAYKYRRTIASFFKVLGSNIESKLWLHGDNTKLLMVRENGRKARLIDKTDLMGFKSHWSINASKGNLERFKKELVIKDGTLSAKDAKRLQQYEERISKCDGLLEKVTQKRLCDFEELLKKVLLTENGRASIKDVMSKELKVEFVGDDSDELFEQIEKYLVKDTKS